MSVSDTVTNTFLNTVNRLTPDLASIYAEAKDRDLGAWKTQQRALVTASGAIAVAIPGLHLAGIAADVAFVINRMSVSTYGTGAILGRRAGVGNILEQEDFAAVLGYWADDEDLQHAMKGKGAAGLTKIGGKVFAKGLTKTMLVSSGYLIGQRIGGKAMAKAAAKFAAKFGGKAVGGFIPFLGPVVSGGVNLWLISDIIGAAERFYHDKARLAGA